MKNAMTITNNTVSATYLPYKAYKGAVKLALTLKGEIGKTDKGSFRANFPTEEVAKYFVEAWEGVYYFNHALYEAKKTKATASSTKKTAKTDKKSTTSSKSKTDKKPKASKGNAFDYSVIKGETKKDKNKALHATLVGMGIADSRTPEYQAVWNARPWAK